MSTYACPQCGHEHTASTAVCPNCGRLLLPTNQLNLVVSLSVVSVAIIAALLYWVLNELIWLPLAQTGLGFVIDAFRLQNHVPYWTGLIERRGFFSANWLLLGALFYIPIITIVTMRLGLRRAAVAIIASPAPFAVMDVWSWWVRAVAIPANVDRASALLPLPSLLQFLAVFAISAVVVTPFYFLFINMGRFLPKKLGTAFLIQPVSTTTAIALPRPIAPALPPTPLELPVLTTLPETAPVFEPKAAIVEAAPVISIQPAPMPEPPVPIVEVPSKPTAQVTRPDPVATVPPARALTPLADEAEFDELPVTESASRSGFPIWMVLAGLAGLAIIGTILIILALRA